MAASGFERLSELCYVKLKKLKGENGQDNMVVVVSTLGDVCQAGVRKLHAHANVTI